MIILPDRVASTMMVFLKGCISVCQTSAGPSKPFDSRRAGPYNVYSMNAAGWIVLTALLLRPCLSAQPAPPPAQATSVEQQLAIYKHLLSDWAGLSRYGSEDSELLPPAPGESRVVFLGDQIFESWSAGGRKF